jgi:hypothetical protein
MSVIQITRSVSSMELARVRETTPEDATLCGGYRSFAVGNDDTDEESEGTYWILPDMLHCQRHTSFDNCTCTARVRLCGTLTDSITQKAGIVRVERKGNK